MEVDITKMKEKTKELSKIVKDYDEYTTITYNFLNSTSNYWIDEKSQNFYNSISKNHIEIEENITNLKKLEKLFKYMIEKYSKYGKKIKYDINSKSTIENSINEVENKAQNLIRLLQNQETNKKQKNLQETIEQTRKKIINMINDLEETEIEIKSKISKISYNKPTEININDYL